MSSLAMAVALVLAATEGWSARVDNGSPPTYNLACTGLPNTARWKTTMEAPHYTAWWCQGVGPSGAVKLDSEARSG